APGSVNSCSFPYRSSRSRPAEHRRGGTMSKQTEHWQALSRAHHLAPFTDYQALNQKGARIITRAEGVYLWDSEGNRILDGMAGLWCVNVGYGREELIEAATRQMRELP